jgi:hypothetical protein
MVRQQHSFWAGALGFVGASLAGGLAMRALVNPTTDSARAAEIKAGLPQLAIAGASYLAMRHYPSQHSLFFGATVAGAINMAMAPASVQYGFLQLGLKPAPTTNLSPTTIRSAAMALPPATLKEKIESTYAKVMAGYPLGG